jgi:hypothetical protein
MAKAGLTAIYWNSKTGVRETFKEGTELPYVEFGGWYPLASDNFKKSKSARHGVLITGLLRESLVSVTEDAIVVGDRINLLFVDKHIILFHGLCDVLEVQPLPGVRWTGVHVEVSHVNGHPLDPTKFVYLLGRVSK